jgi:hypothetical protein
MSIFGIERVVYCIDDINLSLRKTDFSSRGLFTVVTTKQQLCPESTFLRVLNDPINHSIQCVTLSENLVVNQPGPCLRRDEIG